MAPVRTRSSAPRRGAAERRGSAWDTAVSFGVSVSFLAGLWLLMAPFALAWQTAGDEFDPRWDSVLAGFAVAVCSLVHLMALRETPWLGAALSLIGAWLVVTSLTGPASGTGSAVVVSEVVTGVVVLVAALGTVARAVVRGRGASGRHRGERVPG